MIILKSFTLEEGGRAIVSYREKLKNSKKNLNEDLMNFPGIYMSYIIL